MTTLSDLFEFVLALEICFITSLLDINVLPQNLPCVNSEWAFIFIVFRSVSYPLSQILLASGFEEAETPEASFVLLLACYH